MAQEKPAIELDQSQENALKFITDWLDARFEDPKQPQVVRLGGHAGSGKTTLITKVVEHLEQIGKTHDLITFSGKAADVLRRKGLTHAQTIHSLIYVPNKDAMERAEAIRLQLRDNPDLPFEKRSQLHEERRRLERNSWVNRDSLDSDLLIVDEASMVSDRVTNHLLSFGKPILAVGDPAQLPPVEKAFVGNRYLFAAEDLDDGTPLVLLEGKHRFGEDSLLDRAALAARRNEPMPADLIQPLEDLDLTEFDVVLVHSNAQRWKLIHEIREAKGLPLNRPVEGDRIVWWRNNPNLGLFNGGSAVIKHIMEGDPTAVPRVDVWDAIVVDDFGNEFPVYLDKRGFYDANELREAAAVSAKKSGGAAVASFSEVLTCHKAQGSEWPSVLVAAPSTAGKGSEKVRWRYTAVTRASERLVLGSPAFRTPVRIGKNDRLVA